MNAQRIARVNLLTQDLLQLKDPYLDVIERLVQTLTNPASGKWTPSDEGVIRSGRVPRGSVNDDQLVSDLSQPKINLDARRGIGADWPNAPMYRLSGKGTFIVTGSTCEKAHLFRSIPMREMLTLQLLTKAQQYGWKLEAWAVFSNHYHFVGHAMDDVRSLRPFLNQFHAETAREVNAHDGVGDRLVWTNYRDTELTYEKSYLARLNYVHQNAVHHKLVRTARDYHFCSARWFERTASPNQVRTIYGLRTDRVRVLDDFEVVKE